MHQVVLDPGEEVDRHEHVALDHTVVDRLLHEQRADAREPPARVDERSATPLRMQRRGEQGLVEHVLPVARELALVEHLRPECVGAPAAAQHDRGVADLERLRRAPRQRRELEGPERLHHAEARREVVSERMPRHDAAVQRRDPDRFGLGDEIADRQDQPVAADGDAAAHALGTEDRRREGILGNLRAHGHDRLERRVEVEPDILRIRLQLRGKSPLRGIFQGGASFFVACRWSSSWYANARSCGQCTMRQWTRRRFVPS